MKEYLIYTTSSNEPVTVEVDYDLLKKYEDALYCGEELLRIKHTKIAPFGNVERVYDTVYNVAHITSITLVKEVRK
jgi:hypothetical protein